MRFHSRRFGKKSLDLSILHSAAHGVSQVDVLSAFFDTAFLSKVIEPIAKQKSPPLVRIVLHGFAGRKLDRQLDALRALEKRWKRVIPRLEIGLIFGTALFHTKLFVFRSPRSCSAFIGSANATSAAFIEDNEEILLELKTQEVDRALLTYVDEVASKSVRLRDVAPRETRNLAQWYRDAVCYYKPNASFGLRFPLWVPEELAAELARSELDEIDGIARDQTNLTYSLASNLEPSSEGKGRTVIAAVGIQTCYGWWVPSAYAKGEDGFQAKLDRVATSRRRKVDDKCEAILRAHRKGEARDRAHRAFSRLKRLAKGRWPHSDDNVEERFDGFLKKAVEKLQDERWRSKVAAVYAPASVPEIWADPDSVKEFEDSFYDYLEYLGERTGAKPHVWKVLSRSCGFGQHEQAKEIQRAVRETVRRGWTTSQWGEGP